MKILLNSYAYSPGVGGIETVSQLLAAEWLRLGHEVAVVTETPRACEEADAGMNECTVIRSPDWRTLARWTRWADVVFQNNISLRLARTIPSCPRPCVVATQTWLNHGGHLAGVLKGLALRLARRVYISRAIATHVGLPGDIIPNPYDDVVFRSYPEISRQPNILFVGRLVPDKGVDLLLDAFVTLREGGSQARLTIAGSGAAEGDLRRQAEAKGLSEEIVFVGSQRGRKLAELFSSHEIVIVPSRWAEPFGVVAVEAIACGCIVIGSENGGLPEAIGPCGILFQNGSAHHLADSIQQVLTEPGIKPKFTNASADHLRQFNIGNIAQRYLQVFEKATA